MGGVVQQCVGQQRGAGGVWVYGVLMGAGTGLCKTKGTESRDMVPMMCFSLWGPGGAVTCLLLL